MWEGTENIKSSGNTQPSQTFCKFNTVVQTGVERSGLKPNQLKLLNHPRQLGVRGSEKDYSPRVKLVETWKECNQEQSVERDANRPVVNSRHPARLTLN